MKFFIKIFIIIFYFIISIINAQSIENRILYKINSEIITTVDVFNEIKYLKALNPQTKSLKDRDLLEIAKNSIIKEKVKKLEVLKYYQKIQIEEDYLNEVIKSSYNKININSYEELVNHLKKFNVSAENIKEKISIEILWNQLIFKQFSSKISIDKEKIKSEIENNNLKQEVRSFQLSEILYNVNNNSEFKSKTKEIISSIDEIGFENTALKFSISETSNLGGELGWVKENSINKNILSFINDLNVNDYTKPILTPSGFLILKINDIKIEKMKVNIEDEIQKIIVLKTNEQLNQFSNIYYNKIKKNIIIDAI